jgi:hypothetical protein
MFARQVLLCLEPLRQVFEVVELLRSGEPVAHTYNPSYSGGRDQEDHGSKPALGK